MEWLFDHTSFVVRSCCGPWETWLAICYQASSLCTAAAYLVISVTLAFLWLRRRYLLPRSWMVMLFAAFIFLCGCTHLLDFFAFHWPAYRFFTVVLVITAAVSLGCALLLPEVVSHVLKLPSPQEYAKAMAAAQKSQQDLREEMARTARRFDKLRLEADKLREQIAHLEWRSEFAEEAKQLREQLHRIRGV